MTNLTNNEHCRLQSIWGICTGGDRSRLWSSSGGGSSLDGNIPLAWERTWATEPPPQATIEVAMNETLIKSSRCVIFSLERGPKNKEWNDSLSQISKPQLNNPLTETHTHTNTHCVWGHRVPEKSHKITQKSWNACCCLWLKKNLPPKRGKCRMKIRLQHDWAWGIYEGLINKTQNSPFLQRIWTAGVCLVGCRFLSIFWTVFLCRSLASMLEFWIHTETCFQWIFVKLEGQLLKVPGGTLVSEELCRIVDLACLILLLSAHWAAFPPGKSLKCRQTSLVENMGARQQHLK